MFILFFFRGKYGPPTLILAGLASLAVGIAAGHVVPAVVGAGLIVRGLIPWINGKRCSDQTRDSRVAPGR